MKAAPLPYAMQLKDAAAFIGVSEKTLRRLIEQGRIPFTKHTARERVPGAKAGTLLFRTEDLKSYIDSQFEQAAADYR